MSMGSKKHGPSAPRVHGKTSKHPKFRKQGAPKARSPRVQPAPLVSNADQFMPGTPAEPSYAPHQDTLAGVMVAGPGRGKRRDTNANRRNGGTSTTYRPKAEDLAGAARMSPPTTRTNVHAPARVANPKYDPSTYEDTLAASEAAGFRERAMMRRSILVTNGAVTLNGNIPVWMDGEDNAE